MSEVVVEIGPGTVRGPGHVAAETATVAVECLDDDIALVDDRPVSVRALWADVLRSAAREPAETVVLVLPTWWTSTRTELVCDAAHSIATNVVALQRVHLLGAGRTQSSVLVEIASDLVVICAAGGPVAVIPRLGAAESVAKAVVAEAVASGPVLVDAPANVVGAAGLGAALVEELRAADVVVAIADQDWALCAARALRAGHRRHLAANAPVAGAPRVPVNRRIAAVTAGSVLSAATVCGGLLWHDARATPRDEMPMTFLVEGRVALKVPALWTVQRISDGPGSARVQAMSPLDPEAAVHITQSPLPADQTLDVVSQTLRGALDEQPAGTFVEFDPTDHRADRPVVTYREIRPDHHIEWSVLIDDAVRIGIGCQCAPDRRESVRYACDEAIRSAHAVL